MRRAHSLLALVYFDNTNLITGTGAGAQLTAAGSKVKAAYAAIAAGGPGTVTSVSSANGSLYAVRPAAIAEGIRNEARRRRWQSATRPSAAHEHRGHQRHG